MGKEPRHGRWLGRDVRKMLLALGAAAITPFIGCSTSQNSANSCGTVCTCVKNATADPGAEKTCLEECNAAVSGAADPLTACVADVTKTGYPQCVNSCQIFAPAKQEMGACKGYRATSRTECKRDGTREIPNDKACSVTITSGMSGYCECENGNVHIDCGHADGDCEEACHNGYFGHFTTGAGGWTGTGGTTGDAAQGVGGTSTGGVTAITDGGDPCVMYLDSSPLTYACGEHFGLDPNRLYLCIDGKSQGYVMCAAGCAAAPPGQPNYCFGNDPCANLPFDGDVCGSSLANPSADPNTQYSCVGQAQVGISVCPTACAASTDAKTDYCY